MTPTPTFAPQPTFTAQATSTPVPLRGSVGATAQVNCTAPATGTVVITVSLSGGTESIQVRVSMSGRPSQSGVVSPASPTAKISFAGTPNGTYTVSVGADGSSVFSELITVSCQGAYGSIQLNQAKGDNAE